METIQNTPQTLGIIEANLLEIKSLNDMIDSWLKNGKQENSLAIRQMKYQREKYVKEINDYLYAYKLNVVEI